jgi:hypothetical protein
MPYLRLWIRTDFRFKKASLSPFLRNFVTEQFYTMKAIASAGPSHAGKIKIPVHTEPLDPTWRRLL